MEILNIVEKNGIIYSECTPAKKFITKEQDAVDLIDLCGYYQTNNLLIYAQNVDENFFDLKSKLAGEVLTKRMNYYMRIAMVMPSDYSENERFSEMALDVNKVNHFRIFENRAQAVGWLTHG